MRRKWNYISFLLMMMGILFFAACGEKGGMDVGDGGGGEPEPPPKPTYNFTGTLYSESGSSISGATIYIFSPYLTSVTNALGQFSLNISEEKHTVVAFRDGFVDTYRLVDLSPGATLQQTFLLQVAEAAPLSVLSANGRSIPSNSINGAFARLDIPPQAGPFQRGDETGLENVRIRLDYIDINQPLPVPLPSPGTSSSSSSSGTLAPGDVLIAGKQAPSVLVNISPALFSMETPATLVLPNPHGLTGVRILYFSPNQHRWVDTGAVTDDTPADGTALSVSQGGIYGIFYEEPLVGSLRGTATPRTLIFAGDEVIRVPADGMFNIDEIAIPPEGTLQVVSLDPDTGSMVQNSVALQPGSVVTLDLSQVEVGAVEVTAGTGSLFANGISSTSITVIVRDETQAPVPDGIRVALSTTGGILEETTLSTTSGRVETTLTSSTQVGSVTVTARAAGEFDQTTIEFVPAAQSFSLTTSQPTVLTDNSDEATITATVLDADNVPIEDVTVNFDATGGQLSTARAVTDENGQAQVTFSAGNVDRRNQVATITASINDEMEKSIPILIRGNTVSLATETTNLEMGGKEENNTSQLTITALDASEEPIYDAPVTITSDPREALTWEPAEAYGPCPANDEGVIICRTDVNGTLRIKVHGNQVAEDALLIVESLGARAQQQYSVSSIGEAFRIIVPEEDPVALGIGQELPITVNAPDQQRVLFSTTFGTWKEENVPAEQASRVIEVPVVNGKASAILKAGEAGIATIQASDAANMLTFDLLTVAVSAPSDQAAKLTLQASASVVAPTTDQENQNIVELKAVVKNENDQVVGGAPVAFSLDNTTGGGEFISPVIVLTNSFGIARATFTSGSLSSGAEGVEAVAEVVGKPAVTDSISIIIGGTAGSVIIGQSTVIEAVNSDTAYELTMSVLVSDANGNPVPNAKVTLGTWPVQYATGFWASCINGQGCCINRIEVNENEDDNRNLILDPGEDSMESGGNNDGKLTPPSTAAGSLFPSTVTTGENGVAEFDLVYVKESAGWIKDQVTATTTVSGSETQSTYTFWLPWSASDAQQCVLPHSPYNQTKPAADITLTAEPESLTADGQSTSTLQAVVLDADGNIVNDGTAVVFTFSSTGGEDGIGGFPYATRTTGYTVGGIAAAIYRAGNEPTTVTINASSGSVSDSVDIELSQGRLSLSASEYELLANGSNTSTITANLVDVSGQPAQGNIQITFTLSGEGIFSESGQSTYTTFATGGTATATYQAGRQGGTVNITAATEDGLSAQVSLTLLKEEVAVISVEAVPRTIPADGVTSSAVTARLTSSTGESISKGTVVTFRLDPTETSATFRGDLKSFDVKIPTETGEVTVPVIAGTTPGNVRVVVEADGISNSVTIEMTGEALLRPAMINLKNDYPQPTSIRVKGSQGQTTSLVVFEVKNSRGEAVEDGYEIAFEKVGSTDATLSPASAATTNGEVSTVVTSGFIPGTVSVRATYTFTPETGQPTVVSTTSSEIIIEAGLPVGESFSIGAEKLNMEIGGVNQITAKAGDVYGNPVPDGTTIFFKTYNTGGLIYPGNDQTNDEPEEVAGEATSILDPSAGPTALNGVISVTAETTGGPTTHITSLSVAPEDPYTRDNFILYAGTDGGGVYKSTNSGRSWNNVSRSPTLIGQNWIAPYINDVAIDLDNINIIYAGTGYAGNGNVYRSLDAGLTWNSNDPSQWDGLLPTDAAVLAVLPDYDDNVPTFTDYPYVWVGTEGKGLYYTIQGDENATESSFEKSDLDGHVRDIVRVKETHGSNAVLYAGTARGVYKSVNGGVNWNPTGSFSGDSITTLALHPNPIISVSDVIYAGTEDAGVWVSVDGGVSWMSYTSGMRESGEDGSSQTDQGREIKDLLVDEQNHLLYAATYFWGEGNPLAIGKVYVYQLADDGSGYMQEGGLWQEANNGLLQYSAEVYTGVEGSPYVPQHAFALSKNYQDDVTLYIGGEGISFHKAGSNALADQIQWVMNKEGLSNTIMARIPVIVNDPGTVDMIFENEPQGYELTADGDPRFTVRIEDNNGNPPVQGSRFLVTKNGETLLDITFSDDQHHPTIPSWGGYPYSQTISTESGDVIRFELTLPATGATGGSTQWRSFTPPF